ncbi:MAG: TRAP transporter permease [Candidatus Latescibacterota bacterium]
MTSESQEEDGSFPLKKKLIFAVAVLASAFHLYAAFTGSFFAMFQRNIHWMFMATLIFMIFPTRKGRGLWWLVDLLFIALSLISGVYILVNYSDIIMRLGESTEPDMILGGITILLILEATRRAVGWPLVIVAALSILYAYIGDFLPGVFGHRGFETTRIISHLYLTTEGIFGLPLGVSATFIVLFIIFGAFLEKSGASKFFIDLAFSLTGRTMGGPAKAAIVSSGFMGMISGSAVANVVTTGTITIPLMIRTGYRRYIAGAIEALASSGGQIMPPVMGAGAFIMAEMTGTPYLKICEAAFLPAVLFFFSIYQVVHYEAVKHDMKPYDPEGQPSALTILKQNGFYFIPIVLIIVVLVMGRTPNLACFLAILSAVVVSWFDKRSRMGFREILDAMSAGARGTMMVAAATASAGIVVGIITLTGVGLSFSSLIVSLSAGNLLLALILTMVASMILGMGIPTAAAYIVVAVLGAPALVTLGLPLIAAHLFVFYFAVISGITPPVALAAYAGAGIAQAPPMKTALYATLFGLFKFILPFIFVYNTGLLFIGGARDIAIAVTVALVVSFQVAVFSVGYFKKQISYLGRFLIFLPLPFLIYPALWVKLVALAGLTLLLIPSWRKSPLLESADRKDAK